MSMVSPKITALDKVISLACRKKKTGTVMGTKCLHDLKLNISIFITKTAARYIYDPTLLVLRANPLLGL